MSYYSDRTKALGVTPENNFSPEFFHPDGSRHKVEGQTWYRERFVEVTDEILKHELKGGTGIKPGDLIINYFDLNNQPVTYKKNKNKTDTQYRIVRLAKPVGDKKYHLPSGSPSTMPYIPPGIIKKYQEKTKIKTLVLTEGALKTWFADLHGVDIIGFTSITHYKNKKTGTIHKEISEVIKVCNVDNVIVLYDGDCMNISDSALKESKDLLTRPKGFFDSIRNIKELFSPFIDSEAKALNLYFSYVRSADFDQLKNPKGLDDLMMAAANNPAELGPMIDDSRPSSSITAEEVIKSIRIDLLDLSVNSGNTRYFFKQAVTYNIGPVKKALHITGVEDFYEKWERKIKLQQFIYAGTTYKYNTEDNKCDVVVPKEAKNYLRVGDTYYERVMIPDKKYNLHEHMEKRQRGTLVDDYGTPFLSHVNKYKAFCNVPDHIDYQAAIHGCWNTYYEFEHEAKEGDCDRSIEFVKHIFGDYYEVGMDYLQLLYQSPQQKLPVLCLVSIENQTGKSTFIQWLKEIFTQNMSIVGNADLTSDFNGFWSTRLIIACEETLIEKRAVVEKIKSLSTGNKIATNKKGKDQFEADFFGKFIFASNNEDNFMYLNKDDTRYLVIKVPEVAKDKKDPMLMEYLIDEIPFFLDYLNKRKLHTPKSMGRMWFKDDDIRTEAFWRVVASNRETAEKEIREKLKDLFLDAQAKRIMMTLKAIKDHFFKHKKYEDNYLRKVLEQRMGADKYHKYEVKTADGPQTYSKLKDIPAKYIDKAEKKYLVTRAEFPSWNTRMTDDGGHSTEIVWNKE